MAAIKITWLQILAGANYRLLDPVFFLDQCSTREHKAQLSFSEYSPNFEYSLGREQRNELQATANHNVVNQLKTRLTPLPLDRTGLQTFCNKSCSCEMV